MNPCKQRKSELMKSFFTKQYKKKWCCNKRITNVRARLTWNKLSRRSDKLLWSYELRLLELGNWNMLILFVAHSQRVLQDIVCNFSGVLSCNIQLLRFQILKPLIYGPYKFLSTNTRLLIVRDIQSTSNAVWYLKQQNLLNFPDARNHS